MRLSRHFRRFIFKTLATVLLITLLVLGIDRLGGTIARKLYPKDYSEYVEKYCREYDVETDFCYAFIKCESGFDPEATSDAGARGLMQLMPETYEWIGEKVDGSADASDITSPRLNVKYGVWYISYLEEKFHDKPSVIAAYNAGPGKVDEWLSDPRYSHDGKTFYEYPFPETKSHVDKVLKAERVYKKLYKN